MKGILHNWSFFILLAGSQQVLHGQSAGLQKEIAEIIRYEANIDWSVVPGVLVGVMDGDSNFVFSYGEKINADDIYELGSLTKPIVAWLVDQALDSLGWTTEISVCAFLPDSLCNEGWEQVTIDQVLTHCSGLPRVPGGIGEIEISIQDPYAAYDLIHLAEDLGGMTPVPGKYRYSHIGYALLYWLFEKLGGMESFAHQQLVNPYALHKTGWKFPDEKIAQGHGLDGREQPPWHYNALAPAMGLKSSMSDLMNIIELISPQLILDTPPLSSSLKKELKALDKAGAYKVLNGWFLIQSGNALVYYHTGRTAGHQVSIAFLPQKRKGVVVISNGVLGSNELSLLVLDMLNNSKVRKEQKSY